MRSLIKGLVDVYLIRSAALACVCVLLLARGTGSQEQEPVAWEDAASGYEYVSKGFSCAVGRTGVVRNLRVGDWMLLNAIQIFSRLRHDAGSGAGVESRIFQSTGRACDLKYRKLGRDVLLRAVGCLVKGADGEVLAEFQQDIRLSPYKISFSYRVKTLKPLALKPWMPFCSLMTGRMSWYTGWALHAFDLRGKQGIYGMPKAHYSREKECWPRDLGKAAFVRDDDEFSIALPEPRSGKVRMSIQDGRSWQGSGIEILVKPVVKRRPPRRPLFAAGTIFVWSFTVQYRRF